MKKCGVEGLQSKNLLATNADLGEGTKNPEGVDGGASLPHVSSPML